MAIELRRLDASLRSDFDSVMERGGAEPRKCRCTAYHFGDWETAGPARREQLLKEGRGDGYLAYEDGKPVAWCQCGPMTQFAVFSKADPAAWIVTCMVVAEDARRQGVAARLLAAVLEELRHRGARYVKACAHRYPTASETFAELPEGVCRKAGMTLERDDPECPVYSVRF